MGIDLNEVYPYGYKSKHWVDASNFQSRVEWSKWCDLRREMCDWIHQQRIDHWLEREGEFRFAYEKDFIMFALRWS